MANYLVLPKRSLERSGLIAAANLHKLSIMICTYSSKVTRLASITFLNSALCKSISCMSLECLRNLLKKLSLPRNGSSVSMVISKRSPSIRPLAKKILPMRVSVLCISGMSIPYRSPSHSSVWTGFVLEGSTHWNAHSVQASIAWTFWPMGSVKPLKIKPRPVHSSTTWRDPETKWYKMIRSSKSTSTCKTQSQTTSCLFWASKLSACQTSPQKPWQAPRNGWKKCVSRTLFRFMDPKSRMWSLLKSYRILSSGSLCWR